MIVIIETEAEKEKYCQIFQEELTKLFKVSVVPFGLSAPDTNKILWFRVNTRFRAWQMEQPGYDNSLAQQAYDKDA